MRLTIGRTVLFCRGLNSNGHVACVSEPITHFVYRPAIVVAVCNPEGSANLQVFNNSGGARYDRDGIEKVSFEVSVPYSILPVRSSWCWPTHVKPSHLNGQPFSAAPARSPMARATATPSTGQGQNGDTARGGGEPFNPGAPVVPGPIITRSASIPEVVPPADAEVIHVDTAAS